VAQWQAQKQVEASAAVIDPSIQLGVRAYAQDSDAAVVVGISLPLPVWDRRREAMDMADSQARLARRELEAAKWSIHRRFEETLSEAKRRQEEITSIEKQLLPLVTENIALFQEGFSLGKFTLLEMLEAQRLETELQMRLLDAREALQLALIDLEFLTGIPVLEGKRP
jgi:cobalt-zinc-cadmium efflux system outer membrane protein